MNKFEFLKELLSIWNLQDKYYILLPFVAKMSADEFEQKITNMKQLLQKWQK